MVVEIILMLILNRVLIVLEYFMIIFLGVDGLGYFCGGKSRLVVFGLNVIEEFEWWRFDF